MIKGENSDSIPIDLIIEIVSRLPAKSIARFLCVSKLWGSMFLRPYFTDLFLTRSSTRPPRLLFAVEVDGDEWCFFTSPQPQNPSEESSSLVVTADVHMKFLIGDWPRFCGHASGLIFLCDVICNPSTGQYTSLPLPKFKGSWRHLLGFDPIDKQFKVLSISFLNIHGQKKDPDLILTLGTGNDSWRKIHCPLKHVFMYHFPEGICINGVLYYIAQTAVDGGFSYVLVCFDVRSEKFRFMYRDFVIYRSGAKLFNYEGKLGVITMEHDCYANHSLRFCMWVINDVEKQDSEWPKYFTFFWDNEVVNAWDLSISGVTARGEIVLSRRYGPKPFYVFYLNPEKSTLQSVEIQGLGANQIDDPSILVVMVDHVEDLKFITMKDICCNIFKPTRTEA